MSDIKINCDSCKYSVYLDGDDYCKLHEVLHNVKYRTKDILWSNECPLKTGYTESEEKSVQDEKVKLVIDIDKNIYEDIKRGKIYSSYYDVPLESVLAIANGTVLSKNVIRGE